MKKFVSFCIALVMAVTTVSLAQSVTASQTEDEQWSSPFASTAGLHGLELMEMSGSRSNISLLTGRTAGGEKICSSLEDASCSGDVSFKAVLEPCSVQVTVDCIESVIATDESGNAINATFDRFFPARGTNEYIGATSQSIPSGRVPSLWNVPGLAHSNGSLYLVSVQVRGGRTGGNSSQIPREVSASINPVSVYQTACDERFHSCWDQYFEGTRNGQTIVQFGGAAYDKDHGIRCVGWAENSVCALKHAFPTGMRAQITIKLSTVPSGWLHGRMVDPTASITTTAGVTTMVIDAAPTKVPAVSGAAQWSALPTNIQQWFTTNCSSRDGSCGTRNEDSWSLPVDQRNAVSTPEAYRETSFSQLELWSDFLQDKASALPSYWSVRTLSNDEMNRAPDCIKTATGVTGIVSTNATLYSEGPPSFDAATKTLNYKVAALRYEQDGVTEFLGRYDLLLRPDIASCLYGIDDLAVTSDVEVVGEDGQEKTATTSMTRSESWFKFSAANYTHSAPTVKVNLTKLRPEVKRGKSLKITTLRKRVQLKVPRGARVVTQVAASSRSRCVIQGSKVKALKKGTCRLTVSVTPKPTKQVKKPKTIKRTVFVTIR
jgi:hypothetical protein